MFFLGLLLVGGVTYNAVERAAPWIALAVILTIPMMGVMWVNDILGFDSFINESWQALSGVDTPNDVVPECPAGSQTTGWVLLLLFLPLLNAIPGLVAIVGLPLGAVWAVAGGLRYLFDKDEEWLKSGVGVFTLGLAGVVVAGLIMRITHALYLGVGCS